MSRLSGKVAIITGGAKGIGRATSERFVQEGAQVVIWDIDEAAGAVAVSALSGGEYDPHFMKVDTRTLANVEAAAQEVFDQFGKIDILVNNAGITRDASLAKMTEDQWKQVIDVNLSGVFYCTKAVSKFMVENQYGRIINAASVVALYGNYGQTNYVAAKSGLIGMTKVWARELGKKGITVNAIAPGFIATEMVLTVPEKVLNSITSKTPVPRLGEPSEIAAAYAFLASDDAAFISGHCLSVDGGLTV
ncbi:3-oxoacyl-ACP reductase FabG [Pontibacter sp. G13]|uniref:3-oxoacyl-ACP reductase FabG n=1 Tax=Pontibacter sp. G13 TaxID=3074898 RepID=UPI0028891970|nr:3-oxoacyl-ACP reductase FabG [Pontibacter sp. G13]WNJ20470.1 3-oxoacyl-ACP reductase FabG [Pontibacter sp. G13]